MSKELPTQEQDTTSPYYAAPHPLAYSINGFCQATSLSRSQVYIYIKKGHLRAKKVKGRTLITFLDAQEFLNNLDALPGGEI